MQNCHIAGLSGQQCQIRKAFSRLGGCRSCCSGCRSKRNVAFDEVRQQFATSLKHPTARLAKMQAGKLDAKHPHHRTLARPAKGKISMKLEFRQRLLTTTLMVGASMVASPAFAQMTAPATNTPSPPDNSATPSAPDTTAPQAGQTGSHRPMRRAGLSRARRTSSLPARASRSLT